MKKCRLSEEIGEVGCDKGVASANNLHNNKARCTDRRDRLTGQAH